jgi:shikimate 5-dehydrogenase
METYPGQPTLADLETVYHYREINKKTELVGVVGSSGFARVCAAGLNAAFAQHGLSYRCLPLPLGNIRTFRKFINGLKLPAVVLDEANRETALEITTDLEPAADRARGVDLMLNKGEKRWLGYNLLGRAAVTALEKALAPTTNKKKPLDGKPVIIVGANSLARTAAFRIQKRGGAPIIAARRRDSAQELAHLVGCRRIPFEAIYTTIHDVLVICSDEKQPTAKGRADQTGVHPAILRPGLTVMDLMALERQSPLLGPAENEGCVVVRPLPVVLEQIALVFHVIAGKDIAVESLHEVLAGLPIDDVDIS